MSLVTKAGLQRFFTGLKDRFAPINHKHTKSQITDFPSSLPASDVSAWAKAASKPSYTKAEVGLGNVDNTADSAKSVKYATTAGSANAVAWGNASGKPSTYPPSSHTHSYLPLSGGTMTGRITAPEVEATKYFVTPSMVGEGDTSTYYHRVDFGKSGSNKVDFYEYGGVWNFYKNTAAGKDKATLVASIQANGVHANLKGKADTADSATNDSKNQAITGYIRGLSVSGRTVTYTRGDGTTGSITIQDTTYGDATQSAHGLMTAADKKKLDGFGAASSYATMTYVGQQISAAVAAHADRTDNPHGVTAAQVGAYTKAETEAQIDKKVQAIGGAYMVKAVYDTHNKGTDVYDYADDTAQTHANAVAAKYTGKLTLDGWVASTSEEQAAGYPLAQEVTLTAVTPGAPTVMAASEFLTGCGYDPTGVAATDEILDEVLAIVNAGVTRSLYGGKVRVIVKEKPAAEIVVNWIIRTEVE